MNRGPRRLTNQGVSMLPRPLALRLESWRLPFREAVDATARAGAAGVCFDLLGDLDPDQLSRTGRRELTVLLASRRLALAAVGCPTKRGFDDIDKLDVRVSRLKKSLSLASELGAPLLLHPMGKILDDQHPHQRAFLEAVEAVAREAERVGVRFAIQVGWNPPDQLAQFLTRHERHGLAVAYDPVIMMVAGFPTYDSMTTLRPWIGVCTLKDAVRSATQIRGYEETRLGEGEIDWPRFLAALAEIEFNGFLIIESESSRRPDLDLPHALAFLQKWLP